MKSSRFLLKVLPAMCLFLLASLTVFAQGIINGRVVNTTTGMAIPNATVTIKGSNVATQTDANGNFSIRIPAADSRLVITSVGYTTSEVAATNDVYITLNENIQRIDEVVVVAYGSRRKSDLTGSVTAVTTKDFQKGAIGSSEQLLQGKVAGLEITTGGGAAGGGSKIRIRGNSSLSASNDPLLVIDGVPVEGNGVSGSANLLNTINPNDIESMSVLKDASATALYGSRASNGVIIITTKKGTSAKPVFNYNTRFSVGDIYKRAPVLNAAQVRSIVEESGNNNFIDQLGSANTDWQDQIYRKAFGWDNNISVSGRANVSEGFNLPYRISGGYLMQQGAIKTNQFDRYTLSGNLSPKLFNNNLSLNINAKYSGTKNRFADEGGAIGSAVSFDPTQPVYSGNNKYGGFYEVFQNGNLTNLTYRNPLALLMLRNNTSGVSRFIGNIQADYKLPFFPDLHVLFNVGMDRSHGEGTDILDSSSASSYIGYLGKGRRSTYEQTKTSKLADAQLFYEKSFGKSKVDVLVGHGYQEFFTDDVFFLSTFQDGSPDPTQELTFPDDRNGFAIDSYLGRMNINVENILLLTGSVRRDASSKFAKDNRVGYFPAVAAALRLNELFKGVTGINDLKLRGSWGLTGQQDGIDYYSFIPRYYRNNAGAYYQFGDAYVLTNRPTAYDPNITWEKTETINLGLDYAFAQNRISGTFDVYKKKTKDLLSNVPIAPGSNFNVELLQNVGNMEGEGFEATLNLVPVRNANTTWDLGFNVSGNRSKVTNLLKFEDPSFKGIATSGISGGTGNNIGKFAVGYAPHVFFPYKQVYNNDGTPVDGLFEDINRDGTVDEDDRYYYQKPAADFLLGMSTNLTLGKFNIGAAGHGQIGNYIYNNYFSNSGFLNSILNPQGYIGNGSVSYLDSRFTNVGRNQRYLSDYYIENGSFFRIDNINLGYNFGKIVNDKATLRMTANVQNVAMFTKYKGLDPEISASTGVDNNIYPRPRIYSIGADITF